MKPHVFTSRRLALAVGLLAATAPLARAEFQCEEARCTDAMLLLKRPLIKALLAKEEQLARLRRAVIFLQPWVNEAKEGLAALAEEEAAARRAASERNLSGTPFLLDSYLPLDTAALASFLLLALGLAAGVALSLRASVGDRAAQRVERRTQALDEARADEAAKRAITARPRHGKLGPPARPERISTSLWSANTDIARGPKDAALAKLALDYEGAGEKPADSAAALAGSPERQGPVGGGSAQRDASLGLGLPFFSASRTAVTPPPQQEGGPE